MQRLYREHGTIASPGARRASPYFVFGPDTTGECLSDTENISRRSSRCAGRETRRSAGSGRALGMNGRGAQTAPASGEPPSEGVHRDLCRALGLWRSRLAAEWRPAEVRDLYQDMTRYMLRVASSGSSLRPAGLGLRDRPRNERGCLEPRIGNWGVCSLTSMRPLRTTGCSAGRGARSADSNHDRDPPPVLISGRRCLVACFSAPTAGPTPP